MFRQGRQTNSTRDRAGPPPLRFPNPGGEVNFLRLQLPEGRVKSGIEGEHAEASQRLT